MNKALVAVAISLFMGGRCLASVPGSQKGGAHRQAERAWGESVRFLQKLTTYTRLNRKLSREDRHRILKAATGQIHIGLTVSKAFGRNPDGPVPHQDLQDFIEKLQWLEKGYPFDELHPKLTPVEELIGDPGISSLWLWSLAFSGGLVWWAGGAIQSDIESLDDLVMILGNGIAIGSLTGATTTAIYHAARAIKRLRMPLGKLLEQAPKLDPRRFYGAAGPPEER